MRARSAARGASVLTERLDITIVLSNFVLILSVNSFLDSALKDRNSRLEQSSREIVVRPTTCPPSMTVLLQTAAKNLPEESKRSTRQYSSEAADT